MKKTLLLSAFVAASVCASAQLSFGVQAGYDYVTLKVQTPGGNENDHLNGFHLGPTLNYEFKQAKGLGLGAGVFYQFATAKDNVQTEWKGYTDVKVNEQLHNIQIPIRVSYDYDFNRNWGIFAYAGPELNLGIFCGHKMTGRKDHQDVIDSRNYYTLKEVFSIGGLEQEIDYSALADQKIRMFDVMMGLGAGVHYQRLSLTVGYDFGLLNRYAKKEARDQGYKLHQDQLQVSLGYNF